MVLSSLVDHPPVSGVPVAGATLRRLVFCFAGQEPMIDRQTYRQDQEYRYQSTGKQVYQVLHALEFS